MRIITAYTLELSIYHDEIIGRIVFEGQEASSLQSLPELENTLNIWRMGGLKGSFGIGTQLAEKATAYVVQK